MTMRIFAAIAALALLLGGCATAPQMPVSLNQEVLTPKAGRVGVAMTALPKADTSFPGAGCLLCVAAASMAHTSLTSHVQTLPGEGLPELKGEMAELLRRKGMEAVVIEETVDMAALPDFGSQEPGVARKNFSSLRDKYSIDRLLVISVNGLGVTRSYSAYFPTSDPAAVFSGLGYLVDLASNRYEWYLPVFVSRKAEGEWDEPPKFPGLTNAYYQALETGKDDLLRPFVN